MVPGEYVPGSLIWKSFKLQGAPPPAIGVFENQPSGLKVKAGEVWLYFAILCMALFMGMIANFTMSQETQVLPAQLRIPAETGAGGVLRNAGF